MRICLGENPPNDQEGCVREVNGRAFALFNDGGRFFALDNRCPHRGGPLGDGFLTEGLVNCPWHGFQFHSDGRCNHDPAFDVRAYPVSVEGRRVFLDLEASPTA